MEKSAGRVYYRGIIVGILLLAFFSGGCSDNKEVIELRYASAFPEAVAPSQFALHFANYVEEKSGGRVKFKMYHAGVLGETVEMLNLVSTGAIDMTLVIHPIFKEKLPLHNFPEDVMGGMDKTMNYVNRLNFEIPETSALLEAEFTANNIKGLNYCALGEDGILANTTFHSLADMKGLKIGADKEMKAYSQLGLTVVSVSQPDMYEALGRGVCNILPFPVEAVASNRWYEKGKCFMYNGLYHAGQQFVVNLDTWNRLPADIQEIFIAAAKDTEAFSVEWDKQKTTEYEQVLRNDGLEVGRFSEADSRTLMKLCRRIDAEDMLAVAQKAGKAEAAELILKYAEEMTGAQ